jgi:hypothetical protein
MVRGDMIGWCPILGLDCCLVKVGVLISGGGDLCLVGAVYIRAGCAQCVRREERLRENAQNNLKLRVDGDLEVYNSPHFRRSRNGKLLDKQ